MHRGIGLKNSRIARTEDRTTWSQALLAQSIGVNVKDLGRWIKDEKNISDPHFRKLRSFLCGEAAIAAWLAQELDRARVRTRELRQHDKAARKPGAAGGKIGWSEPPRQDLLVGRGAEVNKLVAALLGEDFKPVAIYGPMGTGKSALTRYVLSEPRVVHRFRRRRLFVRLDEARDATAILHAVAQVMRLSVQHDLDRRIRDDLDAEPTVLVLDNAEVPLWNDIDHAPHRIAELARLPRVRLLLSKRGSTPPEKGVWERIEVAELPPQDACRLFLDITGGKHADDPVLPVFLEELGHVPLAIEIMARLAEAEPELRLLREDWLKRRRRLALADDRERDLTAAIRVSHDSRLMSDAGRRLFAVLGRLPDGIAHADLAAFLDGAGGEAASVLRRVGLAFDEGRRLRTHFYVRQTHAADRLLRLADRQSLITHYLDRAATLGRKAGHSSGGKDAMERLRQEVDNLEVAFRLAIEQDAETKAKAVSTAPFYANFMLHSGLGSLGLIKEVAEAAGSISDLRAQAGCYKMLGDIAHARRDEEEARLWYRKALELYEGEDDADSYDGRAACELGLGDIAFGAGEIEKAAGLFEKVRSAADQRGDVQNVANALIRLGELELRRLESARASRHLRRALMLYRNGRAGQSRGHEHGRASCMFWLGDVALADALYERAWRRFTAAHAVFKQTGSPVPVANCLLRFGDVELRRGRYDAARRSFESALAAYTQALNAEGEASCLLRLGAVCRRNGDEDGARVHFRRVQALLPAVDERSWRHGWQLVVEGALQDEVEEGTRKMARACAWWLRNGRPDCEALWRVLFGEG